MSVRELRCDWVRNSGYYRSVNVRPVFRIVFAGLAGVCLAACASAQMWPADTGWPAFPASEAQALLDEAARLKGGAAGADAARNAAEFAFRRDLYSHALDAAELWYGRDRGNPEALALVAALHVADGNATQALDAARAGLSQTDDADRFVGLFAERVSAISPETLQSGPLEQITAQLAEEFPDSAAAVALAARVALRAGRFDQAVRHADALREHRPEDDTAHVIAATALLRAGDLDSALARLTEQLAMRDSLLLEQNYAMLLLEGGQPWEAVSRVRELRSRYPQDPQLALQEVRMLLVLGAANLAEPILHELFARGAQADLCREALGRIAGDRGDWLESIEWYAGIQADELAPAAARGLVRAFVGQEDFDEALATILDLVRRHPEHTFESLPLAAGVLQSAGKGDDALAAYKEALRYRPNSRRLRMGRAQMLADLNKHRSAIRAMEKLLKDYPRDSEVLNALGYTLADRGMRLKEAHEHIRLALELAPDSAAIIDSMGWVLYRLGRIQEAVPLLERALESFPHPEVAAHLCEVLFELGETERATALLRDSLQRYRDTSLLEAVQKRYLQ